MCKMILVLIVNFCLGICLASAQTDQASPEEKAAVLLSAARIYLETGKYAKAEEHILEALKTAPSQSPTRKDAETLLSKTLTKIKEKEHMAVESSLRKQCALLQEAQHLLSEGKFDQASLLIQKVLGDTDNPQLIKKAEDSLARTHPSWLKVKYYQYVIKGWISDFFLIIFFISVLYLVLKFFQWLSSRQRKWLIVGIDDSTSLGVGELIIDSLSRFRERRRPASTGLIELEALQLPSVPEFDFPQQEIDFIPALDSLPQIGSVKPGAVVKVFNAVRKWMNAKRPQIGGMAVVSDGQVIVRLTRRSTDGRLNTITASHKIVAGIDAGAIAAEAASFKMYYLIAKKESSIADSEAAGRLRKGLDQLRLYISGGESQALQEAYDTFQNIRNESPSFDEAYLYEGITLDLMERHEEAISIFHYLVQHVSDAKLKEKALYNKAISLFRKYNYEELGKAIEILENLARSSKSQQEFAASPIKALALAAQANVIAHKSIFWQLILFNGNESREESVIIERKKQKKETVDKWVKEVEKIADELEKAYEQVTADDKIWDDMTRWQLKWAFQSARGNAYLNYAMNFLTPPHIHDTQELKLRKEYLEKAHFAFQECGVLLPSGVETLTNLATVLMELSRTADARRYAKRAIDLNPHYEYAYYRLAQCWEKDNRIDQVVQVLKSFVKIKDPSISRFKEVYCKYSVELARPN
jgi:tetratricopeptide (TPR) repeat protein